MEIRQDPKAWQAGYEAGQQAGKTPPLPPGVDGLAFYSGVIEGQAVRGKNIAQRESHARWFPSRGSKPKPAELIWPPKTANFLRTTTCHMDGRLCDTSIMSRKQPKTCHITRRFIKVPQTVAWDDSQHRSLDQLRGVGLGTPP
jgi:hypothetical protein